MIRKVSASQVKDFNLCQRKWFIIHRLGERPPESDSLKDGTHLHEELEDYLVSGAILQRIKRTPRGETKAVEREARYQAHVAAAAPFLPAAPVPASVHIEQWIELPTYINGPKWVGKVDVIDALVRRLKILDHKSCKNFTHALSEDDLKKDVQMGAYGRYVLTHPMFSKHDRSAVDLTHTYIKLPGKPKVKQITVSASVEEINGTWETSLQSVRSMEKVSELTNWQDVKPSTEACDAYGGCPFKAKCGFENQIAQMVKGDKMSSKLLERLNAEQGGMPAIIIPPDAPERTSSPEEVAAAEAPKAKRGKAKKAEEPAEALQVTTSFEQHPGSDPAVGYMLKSTVDEAPKAPSTGKLDVNLYVDCYPVIGGKAPVPFEILIAPMLEEVCKENSISDIRFIKYDSKARLSQVIKAHAHELPADILVSSMATHAETFLEAIVPRAKSVTAALKGTV